MKYKEQDVIIVNYKNTFVTDFHGTELLNYSIQQILDSPSCWLYQNDINAGKYGNIVYVGRVEDDYILGAFGIPKGPDDNGWMPVVIKEEDILDYAPDGKYIGYFKIHNKPVLGTCSIRSGRIKDIVNSYGECFDPPTAFRFGDRISTENAEIFSAKRKINFKPSKQKLDLEESLFT